MGKRSMYRGASVSVRAPAPIQRPQPAPIPERTLNSSAYALAKANEHKPWARRYLRLRAHGWLR